MFVLNPAAPEQLPQSWVLRFFELLPTHLKLKLRQCSRSLLDLVDGSTSSRLNVRLATLNWKLDFMVAAEVVFDLMCKNVVALDLSSLFVPDARCFGAVVANLSKAVPGAGAPILLPRLQHLTVRLSQVKLLSAIAAATAPCSVKQLSLWCCQACRLGHPAGTSALGVEIVSIADSAHELESVGESLAASVETLAFLGGHHCLDEDPDEGYYPLASFAQCLTKLKSLAIPDCADEYTDTFEEGLASCIAPLHSLTLLHISGTREGINMAGGGMCVDLRHLTSLQDLSFNTTNACPITTAGLKLLPGCSNITALQLTGNLYEFNTDIEVLAGLPNLQTLSLFSGIELKSGDLQPLTACSKLTSLSTDSIVIGPTTPNPGAAADATGTAGSADAAAGPSNQLVPAAAPHALPLPVAAAAAAAGGGGGPVSQWCLASLKSLSVGNVGLAEYLAPLSTFAPHLTRLKDTYYNEMVTRPSSSRGAVQVDALSGLQQLQVLEVDLFTLDRHARHLAGLTGLSTLQELQVEMVGDGLPRSCNMQDGLPHMPYLTRLLMYTQENVMDGDWQEGYDSQEDMLLYQHQAQLKELAIKGSSRVGGFLVDVHICEELRLRLPALRCVRIEECPDLKEPALAQLVAATPAPLVLVVDCQPVSERDCCLLSNDLVQVEFC